MDTLHYPRPLRRLQAFLIDSLILGLLFFAILFLVRTLKLTSAELESLLIISLWASFEPFCVAFTGGSLGHHLIGLRVRRVLIDKKLPLARAYLRFFCKAPLGSLSLITLFFTAKHQAIHDLLTHSLVVHKNPDNLADFELLPERLSDSDHYNYPSKLRRIFIPILYILFFIGIFTLTSTLLIDNKCLRLNICSTGQNLLLSAGSLALIIFSVASIGLGWQGRLYGARRKPKF